MNKTFLYALMFMNVYLFCCQKKDAVLLVEGIPNARDVFLEDISSEFQIHSFELPDSINFGEIDQIIHNNQYLVLVDNQTYHSLLVFDMVTKQFIANLDKYGEGPDEYLNLYLAELVDDIIYIHDRKLQGIISYKITSTGLKFIRKVLVNNFFSFMKYIDGYWWVYSDNLDESGDFFGILKYNSDWNSYERILLEELPYFTKDNFEHYHFTVSQNEIYITDFFANTVYSLDLVNQNSVQEVRKIDFGTLSVPGNIIKKGEDSFYQYISKNHFAGLPLNFNVSLDGWYSFNYLYNLNEWQFAAINPEEGKSHQFKRIKLKESSIILPNPRSIIDNTYNFAFFMDEVEYFGADTVIGKRNEIVFVKMMLSNEKLRNMH